LDPSLISTPPRRAQALHMDCRSRQNRVVVQFEIKAA
jgi:hypothetical protein